MNQTLFLLFISFIPLAGFSESEPSFKVLAQEESEKSKFQIEEVANFKDVIWGLDFLNEKTLILSTRDGEMFVQSLNGESAKKVVGVPKVEASGQGGLLDVRVLPGSLGKKIYFTFSQPTPEGATTALASANLELDAKTYILKDLKIVFAAKASSSGRKHYGSRIEFSLGAEGNNFVFLTVGDRDNRTQAQNLGVHNGKVIRLHLDGTIPKDNPFVSKPGALPEIWSYGHRNPQGLEFRPGTTELWSSEFGPRGGDEINIIKAGANYGWPLVTYGREYWGPKIGKGTTKAGVENPILHYVPSISPSGITFYNGEAFPNWKGNLFIGNLSTAHLRRLVLSGTKVIKQESLLEKQNRRLRVIRQGPDGYLYIGTDDGKLIRLRPSK